MTLPDRNQSHLEMYDIMHPMPGLYPSDEDLPNGKRPTTPIDRTSIATVSHSPSFSSHTSRTPSAPGNWPAWVEHWDAVSDGVEDLMQTIPFLPFHDQNKLTDAEYFTRSSTIPFYTSGQNYNLEWLAGVSTLDDGDFRALVRVREICDTVFHYWRHKGVSGVMYGGEIRAPNTGKYGQALSAPMQEIVQAVRATECDLPGLIKVKVCIMLGQTYQWIESSLKLVGKHRRALEDKRLR